MKRLFKIFAATALAATVMVTLAGCGSGCGSCSGKTRNLASLRSNWYADTTFKDIQPTFKDDGSGNFAGAESLVYSVEKTGGNNGSYSLSYSGGRYETYFTAKTFDMSKVDENFAGEYTSANGGNITAYYFKTELSFDSVTFKVGEDEKSFSGDRAVTECYFLPTKNYLRPLYAKYEVKSTTPTNLNVSNIDSAYVSVDYVRESFYSYSGDSVITKIRDNAAGTESTGRLDGLNENDNSVFDVTELQIVLRAMNNFTSSLSQTVGLYTGDNVAAFTFTGSDSPLIDGDNDKNAAQLAAIQSVMESAGLFTPVQGENGASSLSTVAMNVSASSSMPGVSQRYWFAAVLNDRNNQGRATMVKKSEPLPYNLGSLEYVLTGVNGTMWNG